MDTAPINPPPMFCHTAEFAPINKYMSVHSNTMHGIVMPIYKGNQIRGCNFILFGV